MMKLFFSVKSPYARRVRLAVRETGLMDRVEEIGVETVEDLQRIGAEKLGPGCKVPALICDDGTPLSETLVITRFLNDLAGGHLLPKQPDELIKTLELESIASVLNDSLYVRCGERYRRDPALKSDALVAFEENRSNRCYDRLNELLADADDTVTLATIAIIAALDYANCRQSEDQWREGRDVLGAYFDRMMKRPAFAETGLIF